MLTQAHRELLTVDQVAEILGIHAMTVRRKIRTGQIPAIQLGGPGSAIRVLSDELEAWLESDPQRS